MAKLYFLILFLIIVIFGGAMVGKEEAVLPFMPLLFFLIGYWASKNIRNARKGDNNGE